MKGALANLLGRGRIDQIDEFDARASSRNLDAPARFQRERSEKGELRGAHGPYFAKLA